MAKIIVFRQPFPMGNYKLNEYIGQELTEQGHEVQIGTQISCNEINTQTQKMIDTYVKAIEDFGADVLYFEMLDPCTFKVVEQFKGKKILCHASRGILSSYDELIDYNGSWYTHVMSNSLEFVNKHKNKLNIKHWTYYPAPFRISDLEFNPDYECEMCFVGQGHHRRDKPEYELERNVFFKNTKIDKQIYGDGWKHQSGYQGLLPPNDIPKLYKSAHGGFALISKSQRLMGQINNRYSELAFAGCPIFSVKYDIDWFGAERFINFVDEPQEIVDILRSDRFMADCVTFCEISKSFIRGKETEFFQLLNEYIYV